jgi:hypothetical protein
MNEDHFSLINPPFAVSTNYAPNYAWCTPFILHDTNSTFQASNPEMYSTLNASRGAPFLLGFVCGSNTHHYQMDMEGSHMNKVVSISEAPHLPIEHLHTLSGWTTSATEVQFMLNMRKTIIACHLIRRVHAYIMPR